MLNKNLKLRTELVLGNILVVALVGLVIFFATQTSAFLTVSNVELLLTNSAALGVLCVAMALLVISGHIDLSIGSTVALAGVVVALAATEWNLPPGAAIVAGILAGTLIGVINGVLCSLLGLNAIITTLGMLGVVRGGTLLLHEEEIYGLTGVFDTIGNGSVAGVPIMLVLALAAFLIGALFITLTPWGRHIYAIGVNPQASFLSALPVRALPFWLYVATGTAAGIAGIIMSSRISGTSPGTQGLQLELQVLTVVLLGGVAFAGGRGRLFGVFTAWVFLAVLQNGLVLMNVSSFVQMLASGIALVFAAALDRLGAVIGPWLEDKARVQAQRTTAPAPAAGEPSRV